MDVVDMPREILNVANRVLVIPSLPHATLWPSRTTCGTQFGILHCPRKTRLDQSPPRRIIRVAFRQGPLRVQVFRQYYERVGPKWMIPSRRAIGLAQSIDMIDQQAIAFPLRQVDREEIGPAGNSRTDVGAHAREHDARSITCMSENIDA